MQMGGMQGNPQMQAMQYDGSNNGMMMGMNSQMGGGLNMSTGHSGHRDDMRSRGRGNQANDNNHSQPHQRGRFPNNNNGHGFNRNGGFNKSSNNDNNFDSTFNRNGGFNKSSNNDNNFD